MFQINAVLLIFLFI